MREFRNTALLLFLGLLVYGYMAVYEDGDLPSRDGPRQLVAFPQRELREVTVTRRTHAGEDETFTLRRTSTGAGAARGEDAAAEGWSVTRGAITYGADPKAVDTLLRTLSNLEVKRTVELAPTDLARFGLEKPTATVSWKAPGLEDQDASFRQGVLEIGDRSPVGSLLFVRLGKAGPVFASESWKLNVLMKEAAHFRDRRLFDELEEEQISSIRIRVAATGETRRFVQEPPGVWRIRDPLDLLADADEVRKLLADLNALRARDFLASGPEDLTRYGLDRPTLRVDVAYSSGVTRELMVGEHDLDRANRVRVLVDQSVQPVSVDADLLKRLTQPLDAFREPVVLRGRLDDAERVVVHAGTRAFAFAKLGGPWKLSEHPEADLDSLVRPFLDELGLARAGGFMDQPGDLAAYGLADPAFMVEVPGEAPLRVRLSQGAAQAGHFMLIEGAPTVYRMQSGAFYQRTRKLVEAAAAAGGEG